MEEQYETNEGKIKNEFGALYRTHFTQAPNEITVSATRFWFYLINFIDFIFFIPFEQSDSV